MVGKLAAPLVLEVTQEFLIDALQGAVAASGQSGFFAVLADPGQRAMGAGAKIVSDLVEPFAVEDLFYGLFFYIAQHHAPSPV
jgi:hypothetical protein